MTEQRRTPGTTVRAQMHESTGTCRSSAQGPRRIPRHLAGSIALVVVAGILVGGGSGAHAREGLTERATSGTTVRTVLRFGYDGRSSLRAGSRLHNTAGRGGGVMKVADGGDFARVKGRPGRAVHFPRSGYGIIETADRRAWDPRRRDFSYGTKVKISEAQGDRHSNVMQKGYHDQSGGQWKLQIDRGLPSCVVSGSEGRVLVRSAASVADARWHRLVCRRVDNRVTLEVDGETAASSAGPTGKVSNAAGISIGAKKLGPGSVDQYRGRLDVTFLSMGADPATR
jgi:hypothetical protein